MKYLVLIACIFALVVAKEAVRAEDQTIMDQIKVKARQIYKQFDTDADGKVSMKEVADGINRGLGFGDDDQFSSSSNYVKQIYDKYISGKNSECLNEQDFDEIFATHNCASGKLKSAKKSAESTFETLRNKAESIYSKLDKNSDNHVSLDELQDGLKSGLGIKQSEENDENSIKKYANDLYEKYVKSDSKNIDSFTKADFYDILNDKKEKSMLDRIKGEVEQVHQSLDEDQDGHISLDELKEGIKEKLGLEKQPSEKIEQMTKSASEKAEKVKKSIKNEGKKAAKKVKKQATKMAEQAKDSVEQASEAVAKKARELKDAAINKANQASETIKESFEGLKDSAQKTGEAIADKASKVKKQATKMGEQAKDSIEQASQTVAKKAEDLKDTVKENLENLKDSAEQVGEAVADKASKVKKATKKHVKKISKKASQIGQTILEKAGSAKETIEEVGDSIKEGFSSAIESGEQSYEALKEKASEIYDRFDTDGDNSVSFDELKNSIRESLGFSKDTDEEDEKTLWQSISSMFGAKQQEKSKSYTKEDFKKALGFAKRQKGFLEKTKQKGKQIHERLDANKDGYVSLQQIANGIKEGLGFSEEQNKSEDGGIMNYISGLYQTYVKPDQKDKRGLTVSNFCEIIRKRENERKKNDCESASLLDLDQLKARACDIHGKFDRNNDGEVTLEEAAEGIKSKIGFGKAEETEEFSLWRYVKNLYEKYIQSSSKRELKLSKDDFADIIYEWKSQCLARDNRKEILSQ